MLMPEDVQKFIDRFKMVKFPMNWELSCEDWDGDLYLRLKFESFDTTPGSGNPPCWVESTVCLPRNNMEAYTEWAFVQQVWNLWSNLMEHELKEQFMFDGKQIFTPHMAL